MAKKKGSSPKPTPTPTEPCFLPDSKDKIPWEEETNRFLGVALSDCGSVYHTGLLYAQDNSSGQRTWYLLHHLWHRTTRKTRMPCNDRDGYTQYWWLRLPISPIYQQAMALNVRRIAETLIDEKISYGFSHPKGALTKNGKLTSDKYFLNCATFVLAVLDPICGLELIDETTWESRADDAEYIEKLLQYLKNDPSFRAHEKGFIESCKSARIRASDLAAACTLPAKDAPHSFKSTHARFLELEPLLKGV